MMTDNELAEKTVMSHSVKAIREQIPYFEFAKQMFLAGLTVGRGNGKSQRCIESLAKCAMAEEKLMSVTKEWLEKGYLLYLYFSSATNMYEWKPVDPKYYNTSKITLEGFRKKYVINHKLYNNIEEMLADREELNRNLSVKSVDEKRSNAE